ncbi:glycosyltransferase family 4 protein [Salinicoccus albus]|uniref:glycosyltransferase family 4 protein n=1 Tax=Salinicoccus albus TaxID=418756 RepID=UPI000375EE3F|nr:glycosyltransferase family 4 protein [Salinicoccus albus]
MKTESRQSVFHLLTVPKSLVLMRGQIKYLSKKGYDISILTSEGPELDNFKETHKKYRINMSREINVIKDLSSLKNIVSLFLKNKPLIVNSGTPKAGLLGTIAAFLTRVPVRIYTMRGLKLQTSTGLKFIILWFMEKVCCTLATDVICISHSVKKDMIDLKLVNKDKIVILGNGSSNGIDLKDFPPQINKSQIVMNDYDEKKFTLGYVGRIVKDKGVDDVVHIFQYLKEQGVNCQLILIGSIEEGDPIKSTTYEKILNDENIIYLSHVENPSKYYYLIDVFLFLTAREGFGNVSIESQAAGTPVITYDVTGAKDTVINYKTGFIVKKNDINEVIEKLFLLYNNSFMLRRMGAAGKEYVEKNFSNELVWESMDQFYKQKILNIKQ